MMSTVADFAELARRSDHRGIALALVGAERDRAVYDLEALRLDPEGEIAAVGELGIRHEYLLAEDCPVAGYYDHRVPAIVLHPSATASRDRFTVLHELGHHVQRIVLEWADIWCTLPTTEGERLNEAVADAFAAELLVPSALVDLSAGDVTAPLLVSAQAEVPTASRSALAHQALRDPSPTDDVVVAVCALDGTVVFARAVGRLWAPKRGAVQPGFARLIASAARGPGQSSGPLDPGLVAASGAVQEELAAQAAIDTTGGYAFVVVRPQLRYAPPSWTDRTTECVSPACGEVFVPELGAAPCRDCGDFRCSECGACSCMNNTPSACPRCHLSYTSAERADTSLHECW